MAANCNNKLNSINQKIADLQRLQKKIEIDYISSLSKDIAKMLVKKKAYNIDKSALFKKIEILIDDFIKKQ